MKSIFCILYHVTRKFFSDQVGIPDSDDEGFEIVVEGVTGSYANGWIGLDDLYTYAGECSTEPPQATVQPPTITTAAPGHSSMTHSYCIVIKFL